MSTAARAATPDEYPLLRAIMARAFREDEPELWDYLVAHDPALRPDGVRVAVADGRPVACTVALPRQVRTRRGWAPGAVITLVACDPDCQRQGHGGRTVQDALAWMAAQGLAVAVLYGHPEYYPRFGFAPVLPSLATNLPPDAFPDGGVGLRPATPDDLPALTALYNAQIGIYPCAVARAPAAWLWTVRRSPDHAVLVLPDGAGYAHVQANRDQDLLYVWEGAAQGPAAARCLLAGLQREGRQRGLARLRLGLPPDHLLGRLALRHGADQVYRPAAAGMAAVTDWAPLLPPDYRVAEGALRHGDRPVLQAPGAALTELVLGYRGAADLVLAPDCTLPGGEGDLALLARDFPPGFPRWSLAPFWF